MKGRSKLAIFSGRMHLGMRRRRQESVGLVYVYVFFAATQKGTMVRNIWVVVDGPVPLVAAPRARRRTGRIESPAHGTNRALVDASKESKSRPHIWVRCDHDRRQETGDRSAEGNVQRLRIRPTRLQESN